MFGKNNCFLLFSYWNYFIRQRKRFVLITVKPYKCASVDYVLFSMLLGPHLACIHFSMFGMADENISTNYGSVAIIRRV